MFIIKIIAIALIIIFFCFVLEGLRECNKLKVISYEIKSKKLKNDIKIAVLSDFHSNLNIKEKLLSEIKAFNPHIICIPGDFICSRKKDLMLNKATLDFLREISNLYTVVFSLGNHEERLKGEGALEYGFDEDIISILSGLNIHLLDNTHVTLEGVNLYGISLLLPYYERHTENVLNENGIEIMLGKCDSEKYNILLAHNPEYFSEYAKWGCDLVISGHNHGGLVQIPFLGGVISPKFKLFPKYDSGLFCENESKMVLSNGLGSHTLKLRVNNYPSVQMINLKKG